MAGKGRASVVAVTLGAASLLATAAPAAAQTAAPPAGFGACAGTSGGARLLVSVSNVKAAQGQVAVTLYPDSARRFLAKGGKLARARVTAVAGTTRACLNAPGPGWYSIAVYHDADGDKDYDRSLVGMPTEGFGFSNDAPARAGLPSFSSTRFKVGAGDSPVRIRMRYP